MCLQSVHLEALEKFRLHLLPEWLEHVRPHRQALLAHQEPLTRQIRWGNGFHLLHR
jgi:hypothetical protein